METFEKPEPCRSLGCVVEVVPAEGGGYWIQHATESKRVATLEDGAAWLGGEIVHFVAAGTYDETPAGAMGGPGCR